MVNEGQMPFFVVGFTTDAEPVWQGPFGPSQVEPRQAALRQMREDGYRDADIVRAADQTDAIRIAHERNARSRRSRRHRR